MLLQQLWLRTRTVQMMQIETRNATFDLYFVKNGEALANKVNCVVRQLTHSCR